MTIQKTFTGECPEYNESATVTANYEEAKLLGNPMTDHVYTGRKCSIGSFKGCSRKNCPLLDEG